MKITTSITLPDPPPDPTGCRWEYRGEGKKPEPALYGFAYLLDCENFPCWEVYRRPSGLLPDMGTIPHIHYLEAVPDTVLPAAFPPAPEPPDGHRWEYRGKGWKSNNPAGALFLVEDGAAKWCYKHAGLPTNSNPKAHYCEAVPCTRTPAHLSEPNYMVPGSVWQYRGLGWGATSNGSSRRVAFLWSGSLQHYSVTGLETISAIPDRHAWESVPVEFPVAPAGWHWEDRGQGWNPTSRLAGYAWRDVKSPVWDLRNAEPIREVTYLPDGKSDRHYLELVKDVVEEPIPSLIHQPPAGKQWQYRGLGWSFGPTDAPDGRALLCFNYRMNQPWTLYANSRHLSGVDHIHYWEAVPLEVPDTTLEHHWEARGYAWVPDRNHKWLRFRTWSQAGGWQDKPDCFGCGDLQYFELVKNAPKLTLPLTVGRTIYNRRGNPVRIICTDKKHGRFPVMGLEYYNGHESTLHFMLDGKHAGDPARTSQLDLVSDLPPAPAKCGCEHDPHLDLHGAQKLQEKQCKEMLDEVMRASEASRRRKEAKTARAGVDAQWISQFTPWHGTDMGFPTELFPPCTSKSLSRLAEAFTQVPYSVGIDLAGGDSSFTARYLNGPISWDASKSCCHPLVAPYGEKRYTGDGVIPTRMLWYPRVTAHRRAGDWKEMIHRMLEDVRKNVEIPRHFFPFSETAGEAPLYRAGQAISVAFPASSEWLQAVVLEVKRDVEVGADGAQPFRYLLRFITQPTLTGEVNGKLQHMRFPAPPDTWMELEGMQHRLT